MFYLSIKFYRNSLLHVLCSKWQHESGLLHRYTETETGKDFPGVHDNYED